MDQFIILCQSDQDASSAGVDHLYQFIRLSIRSCKNSDCPCQQSAIESNYPLRYIGHDQNNPVPFLYAQADQRIGKAIRFFM